jgi:hypothetical protein
MTQWQDRVEKQHHGKPFPKVFTLGEGAFPEKSFTKQFPRSPLGSSSGYAPGVSPEKPVVGQGDAAPAGCRTSRPRAGPGLSAASVPPQLPAQYSEGLCRGHPTLSHLPAPYWETSPGGPYPGGPGSLFRAGPGFEDHHRKVPFGPGEGLGAFSH